MKFKTGVIMDILPPILPALWAAERIWMRHGRPEGVTVTSANDSRHSYGSKHFSGLALDFRVRYWSETEAAQVNTELQRAVGSDYDCILEWSKLHIHAEYHPKKAKNNVGSQSHP